MNTFHVPLTTLHSFELVPDDRQVALLLRHSHRFPITVDTYGNIVNLTPEGVQRAEELGLILGKRQVGRLISSPLPRCMNTARALDRGAGWSVDIVPDWRLGSPGAFVIDPSQAGAMFLESDITEIVQRQLNGELLPGMRLTSQGVSLVIELMVNSQDDDTTLDVLVTHDSLLAVVVGHLLNLSLDKANWPDFLEGCFIWQDGEKLGLAWRGTTKQIPRPKSPDLLRR